MLDWNTRLRGRTGEIPRRAFLNRIATAVAAGSVLPGSLAQTEAQDTPEAFLSRLGKDERLIVHNTRTGVLETPMGLLRKNRITPKGLLFTRNNQVLPGSLTLRPHSSEGWTLELTGLIDRSRVVGFDDLFQHEPVEVEAVLQCSGNGRSFYAQSVKTRGTQWRRGGMGNVRWRGVRLNSVLESLGVKIDRAAKFLSAEGKDPPAKPEADDFEHSVPLSDALDRALLASHMNGEPIPSIHGGPLRLIIPGYYATMNIKWLSRLRFEAEESRNRHHARRYRTFIEPIEPGSVSSIDPATSTPTWHQRTKSIIWNPEDGQKLQAGQIEVSGVAWNDGRADIASVEVSLDQGKTWRAAGLQKPSSPYAWQHWKTEAELAGGSHQIWARAFDAMGRSQPLDGSIHWNPSGYEWYGVDKIVINAA